MHFPKNVPNYSNKSKIFLFSLIFFCFYERTNSIKIVLIRKEHDGDIDF